MAKKHPRKNPPEFLSLTMEVWVEENGTLAVSLVTHNPSHAIGFLVPGHEAVKNGTVPGNFTKKDLYAIRTAATHWFNNNYPRLVCWELDFEFLGFVPTEFAKEVKQ